VRSTFDETLLCRAFKIWITSGPAGVVTRLGAGRPNFYTMAVGLTQPSIQRAKAITSSVVKRSAREAAYSSVSTAWVKNEWRDTRRAQ
jgi:hypothetical protein